MEALLQIIAGSVVIGAVLVALRLIRNYWPANEEHRPDVNLKDEALNLRFKRIQRIVVVALIACGISIALVLHALLLMAQSHYTRVDGTGAFRFLPSEAIWWFFPGFAGIVLCWDFFLFCWGMHSEEASIYRHWSDMKAGFRATVVFRIAGWVILFPTLSATVLALPMHSTFGDQKVTIAGFASSSPKQYSYSEIRRIAVAEGTTNRDGSFVADPQTIIDFSDGRRWSTRDSRDPVQQNDPAFVAFLVAKTHLTLEYCHSVSDLH